MKRFLFVQSRPEDDAAEHEFEAILKFTGLEVHDFRRIQADREEIPDLDLHDFAGVIVGGGPSDVSNKQKTGNELRMEQSIIKLAKEAINKDIPYFGICYGFGTLVAAAGGQMVKQQAEAGSSQVELTEAGKQDKLTSFLPANFPSFTGHKDFCLELPPGATLLMKGKTCPIQMIRFKTNVYAMQFHPELDADGLLFRMDAYKHAGYFPEDQEQQLIADARGTRVTEPEKLLAKFVELYR